MKGQEKAGSNIADGTLHGRRFKIENGTLLQKQHKAA